MSPSVVRSWSPRRDVVAQSVSSDQGADDFVERLGLAGLVVKAGATADQSTVDDSGGPEQAGGPPEADSEPVHGGTNNGRAAMVGLLLVRSGRSADIGHSSGRHSPLDLAEPAVDD